MLKRSVVRVAASVPTMLGVAVLVFFLIRMMPGDAIDIMNANAGRNLDPEAAAHLRAVYALDRPVLEQFWIWFSGLLQGDLGMSIQMKRPVAEAILERLPATIYLAVSSLALAILIAVPAGVLSATRRNSTTDVGARLISLLGLSIPNFWLAILLLYVFAFLLHLLPASGYVSPIENPIEGIRHSILPIVALGTALAALTMRMTRSAVLETLGQDYIRTAHSKGLSPRAVIYNHALRNALIPVITVIGLQLGGLLGGSIVIEAVFEWPGVGLLLLRAITNADYPMVQGVVLVIAFFVVMANVLMDISYGLLDPRLRSET